MSAFAALQGDDGDLESILAAKKKKEQVAQVARDREAQAARANFEDMKAKVGQANWADEDDEDDFYSLPVRVGRTHSRTCTVCATVFQSWRHHVSSRLADVCLLCALPLAACANEPASTSAWSERFG